jgi:hypothetical protein
MFFCIAYFVISHYLLNRLLQIEGGQDAKNIILSRYAINHVIENFLMVFIFLSLSFFGLIWYVGNFIFLRHWRNLENQIFEIQNMPSDACIKLDPKNELYNMVISYFNTLQNVRKKLAVELKNISELHQKISDLEKKSRRMDKIDSVFHNINDLLNSIIMSIHVVKEKIEFSKVERLTEFLQLLLQKKDKEDDLMRGNAAGQHLHQYLVEIANMWGEENHALVEEITSLDKNLMVLRNITKDFSSY